MITGTARLCTSFIKNKRLKLGIMINVNNPKIRSISTEVSDFTDSPVARAAHIALTMSPPTEVGRKLLKKKPINVRLEESKNVMGISSASKIS